ncbi:5741_t:CDS:2 [Diversispora eburnea]|uniref:5741_t:CDS:1 n=1 Tax=Diversispora eburnea TaxID=1213867 RepID=A0A9N8V3N2_9GLOM|nr:5741_t:CDS:2 [Diversispora eburnea]
MSQDLFKTAADEFAALVQSGKVSNEDQLKAYGWYKQATVGDVSTTRPSVLFVKETAKWDAWNERKGTSQADSKEEYIKYVNELKEKYK